VPQRRERVLAGMAEHSQRMAQLQETLGGKLFEAAVTVDEQVGLGHMRLVLTRSRGGKCAIGAGERQVCPGDEAQPLHILGQGVRTLYPRLIEILTGVRIMSCTAG
jgi:hypothetical protein